MQAMLKNASYLMQPKVIITWITLGTPKVQHEHQYIMHTCTGRKVFNMGMSQERFLSMEIITINNVLTWAGTHFPPHVKSCMRTSRVWLGGEITHCVSYSQLNIPLMADDAVCRENKDFSVSLDSRGTCSISQVAKTGERG